MSVYSSVSRQADLLRAALCWLHTSLVLRQFLFDVLYFFFFVTSAHRETHAHTVQSSLSMPYLLWSVLLCLFRFASTQQFCRFNSPLQDRVSQRVFEMASNQMSLFLSRSKGQWETSPSHLVSNISSCLAADLALSYTCFGLSH